MNHLNITKPITYHILPNPLPILLIPLPLHHNLILYKELIYLSMAISYFFGLNLNLYLNCYYDFITFILAFLLKMRGDTLRESLKMRLRSPQYYYFHYLFYHFMVY